MIWLHTYGMVLTGEGRPEGTVRYPAGTPEQPLSRTPVTSLPETIAYDAAREVLSIGTGEFGPVRKEVWNYSVGGKNVIKSWFNYRKKEPGGKKSSPLDLIHPTQWDPEWTFEAIDLLTVLTRLIDLEGAQATLLTAILARPVLDRGALQAAGVSWPTARVAARFDLATAPHGDAGGQSTLAL